MILESDSHEPSKEHKKDYSQPLVNITVIHRPGDESSAAGFNGR